MNNVDFYKEQFDQSQLANNTNELSGIRQKAFDDFNRMGIPTVKNEDWKYTRISGAFNEISKFSFNEATALTTADIDAIRLPGNANELIFINGVYSDKFSTVRSKGLTVQALEEAANNEYKEIVHKHFNHSSNYLKDGINALNTAFLRDGIFVHVPKNKIIEHPVYIYNITDARSFAVLSQPRSLIHISENAQVEIVETYATLGDTESITNQIMEIIVEQDANLAYYKIQNDAHHACQVSTTHIRQVGKSYVHTVTISLNGDIVRNNLNVIMEAPFCESHLYGLYLQKGKSHIDNHTIVDNAVPNCLSNELYKGILDNDSTGVFNGKVFVRKDAQKTNAFQSNKNVLLSDKATVNTKPQLEIFADDVKCSHGCTVGSLNDEALFYLQSRGVPQQTAMSLLLQGFATDVLEKIKPAAIRAYVDQLITDRLTIEA